MPIPVKGFRCETCIALYPTEEEAKKCESGHTKLEELKITSAQFRSLSGLYGSERAVAQRVPKTLVVKFGDEYGMHALYRLESIGPQGL